MTIGSKKKSTRSSMRIVKFLDAPGGFYGRMFEPDEPEGPGDAPAWVGEEREQGQGDGGPQTCGPAAAAAAAAAGAACPGPVDPEGEGFDANDGVTEGDDGETLLRVKVSRGGPGSRWSRRGSRRKPREAPPPPEPELTEGPPPSLGVGVTEGHEPMGALIHFTVTGDADDQVLIRDKKRGREEEEEEEGEEERRLRREQEEGMKTLKRNTVKNYRKALDRAFRRGWEAFITNLYSVTLNPVTSPPPTTTTTSSSTTPSKKHQRSIILAEFK
ncbi:uncharacterized protein sb:cb1058 [Gadus macrocephalus]|uniref:uncharacterized protein sb:cb1058 n=1 Tax=Gadus macrocephalus TaxID=80720 RepID=UPI0028CB8A6C|nr:uncharacterized protein sb:cb1058 [Gadus macrocephalus]